MAVNPVTLADVEARFRTLTDEETAVAEALLADAWAILLVTVPTLATRISSGAAPLEVVAFVESSMVLRVLRNPNGVKQWSVDDYSETRDSTLSAGSLYASPEEVALLNGTGASRRGAFSVTPAGESHRSRGAEWQYGSHYPSPYFGSGYR